MEIEEREDELVDIESEKMSWMFNELRNDLDIRRPGVELYYIIYIARRFLLVLAAIFFSHIPIIQAMTSVICSLCNLTYLLAVRPFPAHYSNKVEVYNELFVYMCSLFCSSFLILEGAQAAYRRKVFGTLFILFMLAGISVGMYLLTAPSYRHFKREWLVRKLGKGQPFSRKSLWVEIRYRFGYEPAQ